jgi:hypothetical protein
MKLMTMTMMMMIISVIQKAVILDACHITRRFLNYEDHEVDSNIKEYEDA